MNIHSLNFLRRTTGASEIVGNWIQGWQTKGQVSSNKIRIRTWFRTKTQVDPLKCAPESQNNDPHSST
jgi:hypothetical protein